MTKMMCEQLEKKLKKVRVEVCLNCKSIGKFEECDDFVEVEDEAWMISKI